MRRRSGVARTHIRWSLSGGEREGTCDFDSRSIFCININALVI
jgi:hypothetical protein